MPPILSLILGAVCISLAPIIVKMVETGPTVSAWYRVFLGGNVLLALSVWRRLRPLEKSVGRHDSRRGWLGWCLAAGFFFALDLAMWHQAIIDAGAGISTFLANLNVFYLTLFGIVILRERVSMPYLGLTLGALMGSFLMIDILAWRSWSPSYGRGIFLGFLTGMAYSGYILSLRQAETRALALGRKGPLTLALVSLATAFFLLAFVGLSQESLLVSRRDFALLLALALIAQVCGWSLIGRALPSLPVSVSGLLLLLQPVLASLWAVWLFEELWQGLQILGAVITLLCIYGGNLEASRRKF